MTIELIQHFSRTLLSKASREPRLAGFHLMSVFGFVHNRITKEKAEEFLP